MVSRGIASAVVMLGLMALEALLLGTLIFWTSTGTLPLVHVFVLAAAAVVLVPAAMWDLMRRRYGPPVVLWRFVLVFPLLTVAAVAGSVWQEIYSTLSRSDYPGFYLDPVTTWGTVAAAILNPVLAEVLIRPSKSRNEERELRDEVCRD